MSTNASPIVRALEAASSALQNQNGEPRQSGLEQNCEQDAIANKAVETQQYELEQNSEQNVIINNVASSHTELPRFQNVENVLTKQ